MLSISILDRIPIKGLVCLEAGTGAGKTSLVKHVLRKLDKKELAFYVDCSIYRTE